MGLAEHKLPGGEIVTLARLLSTAGHQTLGISQSHVASGAFGLDSGFDHFLKPDLVAPGNRVVAPMSVEAKLMVDFPERIASCCATARPADYPDLSGTSTAAPMVTGTATRTASQGTTLNPPTG